MLAFSTWDTGRGIWLGGVLGLLELAAPSLYEELTIPHGPWHEVLYPNTPLGLIAGPST